MRDGLLLEALVLRLTSSTVNQQCNVILPPDHLKLLKTGHGLTRMNTDKAKEKIRVYPWRSVALFILTAFVLVYGVIYPNIFGGNQLVSTSGKLDAR